MEYEQGDWNRDNDPATRWLQRDRCDCNENRAAERFGCEGSQSVISLGPVALMCHGDSRSRILGGGGETGKFGLAARSLGMNTSAISRRIGRLEDKLGLALFERGPSGVRLTAGGKAVMVHVRRALAELDLVKRAGIENGSGDVGQIRLGVRLPPIGEPLVPLLKSWREAHPNVALTVAEMNDRDLGIALEERRLDVAMTSSNAVWPHATTLPIHRDQLVAALPLGHSLANRTTVTWDELGNEHVSCKDGMKVRLRAICMRL